MHPHHFISYSSAEGVEFAGRLVDGLAAVDPPISVWMDKREGLKPGRRWRGQLGEAIKACETLLFVMTPDSVEEDSVCTEEWTHALQYKKPVIPLLLERDVEVPFGLSGREHVDFTGDFDAARERLREFLVWLNSPAGRLRALQDRLSDAKRDLRRAGDQRRPRIEADVAQLEADIVHQQQIVDGPSAATDRAMARISHEMEQERRPAAEAAPEHRAVFINPPPVIAPHYFRDRHVESKLIGAFLADDAQRMLTVVGRGGIGKTAMVCRLLRCVEQGRLPDDGGELSVDGIVYLSETGSHRANVAHLYTDLCRLLPEEVGNELQMLYKNPRTTTAESMEALLEAFPAGRVVVLLDNFESRLDPETRELLDADLDDALRALLRAPPHAVKVIVTTRVAPKALALVEPGRQRPLHLDEGLPSPDAEDVLREMDADGRVGLKGAPDELLGRARERTGGNPRALEALFAILSADRDTSLQEILDDTEGRLPDNVVQVLVGEAFSRLDHLAQLAMQALAVYGRPVAAGAVDYVLLPYVPGIDSKPLLTRLVNMSFARKEAGRYHLHEVDRGYALSRVPEGSPADRAPDGSRDRAPLKSADVVPDGSADRAPDGSEDRPPHGSPRRAPDDSTDRMAGESTDQVPVAAAPVFSRYALLQRAADYFAGIRRPAELWKGIEDLRPQVAEFELRFEGREFDAAAQLVIDISDTLYVWGHYLLLAELSERLRGRIDDLGLCQANTHSLASAYLRMGRTGEAITLFEEGLEAARGTGWAPAQSAWLGGLGTCYADLGHASRAIEFHEAALAIDREAEYGAGMLVHLGNAGLAYATLGQTERAFACQSEALDIARAEGDRRQECHALSNLGYYCAKLGRLDEALGYHETSQETALDIGYRLIEAANHSYAGDILVDLDRPEDAIARYDKAIDVADAAADVQFQTLARRGLALLHLYAGDLDDARSYAAEASRFDLPPSMPQNNQNALVLTGVICLLQGDGDAARANLTEALAQADEIIAIDADHYKALDTRALCLCGLGLVEGDERRLPEAVAAFRAARRVNSDPGVVARLVRFFEVLAGADAAGVLGEAREAAGGASPPM